jgi:tripartite-type tricarboxylate transporter receptor subunit TctC
LGSNAHLVCLYLESLAGIKLRHVAYRGTGPAVNDLIGEQIDGMCDSAPNMVPQISAGTIRALAVAQLTRIAAAPNVPSAVEAGLPAFHIVGWNALVGPAKMPKAVASKLNAALTAALKDDGVRARIEALGAIPPKPEEASAEWMDKFLRSEAATWNQVITAAGIKVD